MIGLIARQDDSGLGVQSRNLCRMLKPDKILVVDFQDYNGNKQHPEWYEDFNAYYVRGIPENSDCMKFSKHLTHLITAETFYNRHFLSLGRMYGFKTLQQHNWEFLENHGNPGMYTPNMFLSPSYWHLEDMQETYGNVMYLPPPTFSIDFKDARETNLARKGSRRFVMIVGNPAVHDRAGYFDVINALAYTDAKFELVIRSQKEIEDKSDDPRVHYDIGNVEEQSDMYKDFDAMIMPRRYGGLNLPMNEALMSALPVIMTDISPNNQVLPKKWLVQSYVLDSFRARTMIDVHTTEPEKLANKIEQFVNTTDEWISEQKIEAYEIALREYDPSSLLPKYQELFS